MASTFHKLQSITRDKLKVYRTNHGNSPVRLHVLPLLETGRVRPVVDSVFKLEGIREPTGASSNESFGKVGIDGQSKIKKGRISFPITLLPSYPFTRFPLFPVQSGARSSSAR